MDQIPIAPSRSAEQEFFQMMLNTRQPTPQLAIEYLPPSHQQQIVKKTRTGEPTATSSPSSGGASSSSEQSSQKNYQKDW